MQNKLFVDTGFVIALIYQRDQYHQQASNLSIQYKQYSLLTTDAVLLEIGNAVVRHSKPKAIEIIEYFLTSNNVEVVRLTPELFDRAFDLYKKYLDKQWGLVDCISFEVMREAGVNQVLTFDQHFAKAGFQILTSN